MLDVVVLGGGGHVGLPLSLSLADAGLRVGIYDIDRDGLANIAAGAMPFREDGAEEALARVRHNLVLDHEPELLSQAKIVVIVVGTPVDEYLGPSMRVFERLADEIAPYLSRGTLVILRSTVYPGTTEYFLDALTDRGCEVNVAFCPERIAEGRAMKELRTLPQIIGADHEIAATRASALFELLGVPLLLTTTREAELAKLFTNVWRYTKFAVANQFLLIAQQAGLNYANIQRAVRENYPRAVDLPSPGFAAGPCLFKDTMQLAAYAPDHFPMGQAAMQVNEGMPAFLVANLRERMDWNLRGHTIGILGMAFKAESDDTRASLSFKLRTLLEWEGARVLATDPYVKDKRLVPLEQVLEESEILVIGAPHHEYRTLDRFKYSILDLWNAEV